MVIFLVIFLQTCTVHSHVTCINFHHRRINAWAAPITKSQVGIKVIFRARPLVPIPNPSSANPRLAVKEIAVRVQ